MYYHWDGRKAAFELGADWIKTNGFHGNRKPPLIYNGENDVSTFSRLFLIRFFVYLQVINEDMHKISEEFQFRPDRTTDYGVCCLERLKVSHRLIMGKWCLHARSFIFDRIIIKAADNKDRHKSSDEFDFGPLVSMPQIYVFCYFRVICLDCWKDHIWPWYIGLKLAIVALWATCYEYSFPRRKFYRN